MSQVRSLQFDRLEQVIEEINRLRKGYTKAGNWSLEQICWHLDKTIQARMAPGPFPANTPEQDAAQAKLRQVLADRKLPSGENRINAPEVFLPPTNPGETAITSAINTINKFSQFTGPIAPHRIFGQLNNDDARQLNLIHCAHHLSHLIPNTN